MLLPWQDLLTKPGARWCYMYAVPRRRTTLRGRPAACQNATGGGFAMTSTNPITRRSILAALLAAGGSSQALATAPAEACVSPDLAALIKAHRAAYRCLVDRAVHNMHVYNTLNRAEEGALLAICAYPAVTQADRRVKVRCLLAIEKRGELDLPEQMEALLRSMV